MEWHSWSGEKGSINFFSVEIIDNPMYSILNLCRVLAYKKHELILSKQEGGRWVIVNLPEKDRGLILNAMLEYQTEDSMVLDEFLAVEYADYMLAQIKDTEAVFPDYSNVIGRYGSGKTDRPLVSYHPRCPEL